MEFLDIYIPIHQTHSILSRGSTNVRQKSPVTAVLADCSGRLPLPLAAKHWCHPAQIVSCFASLPALQLKSRLEPLEPESSMGVYGSYGVAICSYTMLYHLLYFL